MRKLVNSLMSRGAFNHNRRWVPDSPQLTPFFCFAMDGLAIRNGHRLTARGWYYVDRLKQIHGPFSHRYDAEREIAG